MTDKEAIEILKPLTEYHIENGIGTFPMVSTSLQAEALNFAIEALEERPIEEIAFDTLVHKLNLLIGVLYSNQLISESDINYIEDNIKKLIGEKKNESIDM